MTNQPELFDVDFFLRYLGAIPENQWCAHLYDNDQGQHCALGHCGARIRRGVADYGLMADALHVLIHKHHRVGVAWINDRRSPSFPQPTPNQRILAALHHIQAHQDSAAEAFELRPLNLTAKTQLKEELV